MKIQWLANAGVILQSSLGTRILMDPWVNEGAYLGSWFHSRPLPDLRRQIERFPIDAILISHLHTDHFDRKFLSSYLKRYPATTIVIPQFVHPWLRNEIIRIKPSLTILKEASVDEPVMIRDVEIRAIPTGPCDPRVCGVSFKCVPQFMHSIDGIFSIESDGLRIINASDAMTTSFVPSLVKYFEKCDLLMGHYGAASPYPQAFTSLSEDEKAKERDRVLRQATGLLAKAADAIGARYVFPFAGDYLLGGRLSNLNRFVASSTPEEAVKELNSIGISGSAFSLEHFGVFDLLSERKTADYSRAPKAIIDAYLKEISTRTFPYERDQKPISSNLQELLLRAATDVVVRAQMAVDLQDASYVVTDEAKEIAVTLNFQEGSGGCVAELGDRPKSENLTRLTVPIRLLARLVNPRVATSKTFTDLHWNQADGGSHFSWYREGFFPEKVNHLMSFFGKRPNLNLYANEDVLT